MSTKESVLGVRLPPELAQQIEAACERLGISKPDLMRMLITRFLSAYDSNGQKITLPLSVDIGVAQHLSAEPAPIILAHPPPSEKPFAYGAKVAETQSPYGTKKKGKPT